MAYGIMRFIKVPGLFLVRSFAEVRSSVGVGPRV